MGASLLAVAKSIYYEICIQYIVVGLIIKTFMSQKRILNGDLSYLSKRTEVLENKNLFQIYAKQVLVRRGPN